jgi:hypothetical protein
VPKKSPFDIAVWARSTKRKTGGLMCTLCAAAPDVQEALKTIKRMRLNKESNVSVAQIQKMLAEEMSFRTNSTSLSRHMREHLK